MRYLTFLFFVSFLVGCSQGKHEYNAKDQQAVEASAGYVEGVDYSVLSEKIVGAPSVIEIFYYGCESCFKLAELVDGWSASSGLEVVMVPAHNEQQFVSAARLFHTLESVGRSDLQSSAFALYHTQSALQGEDRINAMLDANSVDRDAFWDTWSGEHVTQRLNGSYKLNAIVGTQVTPTFIVKGKYKVELEQLSDSMLLFELLEYLAELEE